MEIINGYKNTPKLTCELIHCCTRSRHNLVAIERQTSFVCIKTSTANKESTADAILELVKSLSCSSICSRMAFNDELANLLVSLVIIA